MLKKHLLCFFLILILGGFGITAQIQFEENQDLISTQEFNSGIAIGITDMNGDGVDDLVRLQRARRVYVDLQTGESLPFFRQFDTQVSNNPEWNVCVGDINNDGMQDMMTSGTFDNVKLLTANALGNDYTISNLPGSTFFAQAANFADINNDGYLDAFVCDDNSINKLYLNDSTGNLVLSEMIDLRTDPPSDNSGNYGSVWTDFDSDGDLDLYIAKCRQGVDIGMPVSTDPRRINMLFLNDGNNNFTEVADSFGLAISAQSWTADFQDIDNDGDFDCFITNHDGPPSMLLENIDNDTFVDITEQSGIQVMAPVVAVQGVLRDFDNDGFVDVLVTGTNHFLYRNRGDKTFARLFDPFPGRQISTFAIGDLNGDGFQDIYAGYPELFNNPSAVDDKVWLNRGNGNNHITIRLVGDSSNTAGIGARLELYGAWGMQLREVRAGESYGIVNSAVQHFGIGSATTVDSLVIKWPSGMVDVHHNPDINRRLTATEGACLTQHLNLGQGPFYLCGDTSFVLAAPEGFMEYSWSNGDTASATTAQEAGVYYVRMTDSDGCTFWSMPVSVLNSNDPDSIPIEVDGELTNCDGDFVVLSVPADLNLSNVQWNNGAVDNTIAVDDPGSYSLTAEGFCGVLPSVTVNLDFINVEAPVAEGDSVEQGETANLTAQGGFLVWYADSIGGAPLDTGASILTAPLDSSTTYYVDDRIVIPGAELDGGMPEHAGGTFYNSDQFNGVLIFDVHERHTIQSVTVNTEFPGERTFLIRDSEDNTLYSATMMIDSGRTIVPIGYEIEVGNEYQMLTDINKNNEVFGVNSPKLWRSEEFVDYPYVTQNVLTVQRSNFGQNFYYYFYDWKIQREDRECVSERVAVDVFVDLSSSVERLDGSEYLKVYPNPVSELLIIELRENTGGVIDGYQLRGIDGRLIVSGDSGAGRDEIVDVSGLHDGIYLLSVNSGEQVYNMKVTVAR